MLHYTKSCVEELETGKRKLNFQDGSSADVSGIKERGHLYSWVQNMTFYKFKKKDEGNHHNQECSTYNENQNREIYIECIPTDQIAQATFSGFSGLQHRIRQCNVLSSIQWPYVQPTELFYSPKFIYIVVQDTTNIKLVDLICSEHKLKENLARRLFQQLILTIYYYFKQHNFVHWDIQIENLLVDKSNNLIINPHSYGCIIAANNIMYTQVINYRHNAPEQLSGQLPTPDQEHFFHTNHMIDIWSSGVALLEMLSGNFAFLTKSFQQTHDAIAQGRYKMSPHISEDAADLIKKILIVDSTQRITAKEIFNHRWFKQGLGDIVCDFTCEKQNDIATFIYRETELYKQDMNDFFWLGQVAIALREKNVGFTTLMKIVSFIMEHSSSEAFNFIRLKTITGFIDTIADAAREKRNSRVPQLGQVVSQGADANANILDAAPATPRTTTENSSRHTSALVSQGLFAPVPTTISEKTSPLSNPCEIG